ncbi:MAG: glycine cleavage system aminomethyltransferase GcvT [Elusimicrobia bacterium]|nr:glycine cleavage system aminomethyltransferase GcvT [Elusimicrobiota bacterium]
MANATESPLKHTPLHDVHKNLGAKMVPFAGFEMPIQYHSIIEEHQAVRYGAGLFDVSHMGQIFAAGPEASRFLNYLLTNEIAVAPTGSAIYSHMDNEKGGVVDDLIVYKLSEKMNLLVVNASRLETDWQWIQSKAKDFNVQLSNESEQYGIAALQGPAAVKIGQTIEPALADIGRFKVAVIKWQGHDVIAARTGYTGEDGFEFIAENEIIRKIWDALWRGAEKISPFSPCGLGARDTLRLEAGYPLWGHEMDENTTTIEAGYSWVIRWQKDDFIGKSALETMKTAGPQRKIFGFIGQTAGPIARHGAKILTKDGQTAGLVTSGSFSPTLKKPIALGFLTKDFWNLNEFILQSGERSLPAAKAPLPFYKPSKT